MARKLGSGCDHVAGIRLSTTSSVVVDRSSRKAVEACAGMQNAEWWKSHRPFD